MGVKANSNSSRLSGSQCEEGVGVTHFYSQVKVACMSCHGVLEL